MYYYYYLLIINSQLDLFQEHVALFKLPPVAYALPMLSYRLI
jgi:hypothetical protein